LIIAIFNYSMCIEPTIPYEWLKYIRWNNNNNNRFNFIARDGVLYNHREFIYSVVYFWPTHGLRKNKSKKKIINYLLSQINMPRLSHSPRFDFFNFRSFNKKRASKFLSNKKETTIMNNVDHPKQWLQEGLGSHAVTNLTHSLS
jgi:hypothetical protein